MACSEGKGTTSARTDSSVGPSEPAAVTDLPIVAALQPYQVAMPVVFEASEIIIRDCMEQRGFDYAIHPFPGSQGDDFSPRTRYGAIDRSIAAKYGYHDPNWQEQLKLEQERVADNDKVRPSGYIAALIGKEINDGNGAISSDGSGCSSVPNEALFGNPEGLPGLPGYRQLIQMQQDSGTFMLSSVEVAQAKRAWSTCMAGSAFSVTDWWDVSNLVAVDIEKPPTNEEIRIATIDADCRESSGFTRTMITVDSEEQRRLFEQNPTAVKIFRDSVAATVERASRYKSS